MQILGGIVCAKTNIRSCCNYDKSKRYRYFRLANIKPWQISQVHVVAMASPQIPTLILNNGIQIPVLGLGTWQGPPGREAEVGDAVKIAIDLGYRHFDCAYVYGNEGIIGDAIAEKISEGVVKREELFIVSKLWSTFHRPALVESAIRKSLKDLKLDYLDLYLIHWPFSYIEGEDNFPVDPKTGLTYVHDYVDFVDTWKAMEELQKKGLTRTIGISNFNSKQIDRLLKSATIVPVTNQVECHPYLNQKKLREFCLARGITITSYSPLGSPSRPWQKPGDPDVLNDAKIKQIAQRYNKTPAQILLRWNTQLGNAVIPKSSNRQRLAENLAIFDFDLAPEDMEYINTFDCNGRICPHETATNLPDYPFRPDVEF